MMSGETVRPFDSFTAVYKMLTLAGYYKLLKDPKNKFKRICHQVYRPLAFLVAVVYNMQHIIFIIQSRNNTNDMFDGLMLEIPLANLIVKYLTLNLQTAKIEKIHDLLNNPIFATHSKKDEELLLENTKNMHRLSMIMNIAITVGATIWPSSYFVKRYHDETAVVTSYVPFETNTWARFTWSVGIEVIPLLWIGYGHIALDCVVATYYAQAGVQLRIIKYNLQRLFYDEHDIILCDRSLTRAQYTDVVDDNLKERFVHYVKRYETLTWYTKEVDDIFNISMSIQFFTSSVSLCVVIYRMSMINVLSVPFMFMALLLMILLTQVFLYCHYGNLVQYEMFMKPAEKERTRKNFSDKRKVHKLRQDYCWHRILSQAINDSIYLSDWLSASPQFRRLLLIAMTRWSRILTPRVTGFIPLSLTTFITIVRSAYSLYAVLKTKKE